LAAQRGSKNTHVSVNREVSSEVQEVLSLCFSGVLLVGTEQSRVAIALLPRLFQIHTAKRRQVPIPTE
jgi:hypothetical protein